MRDRAPQAEPTADTATSSVSEVARVFLKLGFTAFGGPAAHIAMMRQETVQRRKWLSDERFADLLGVVNLIPGPNSTELGMYLGYVRAGWPGLIVGGACFIGPAMLVVLALAWAYVRFGSAPQAAWLLYGIQPVVIAIILSALVGLGRTVLRDRLPIKILVALGAVALYFAGITPLVVLFGGGVLYVLTRLPALRRSGASRPSPVIGVLPATLSSAGAGAVAAAPIALPTLFLTFLKIGAVLYGSGYVLLAFLRADFVQRLGWLSDRQLLDAVAVGQFTPGPVFTTATFVGYLVAGWQGALVATLAIFLPAFAFVGIIHRLAGVLRRSPWTAALLDGVNVAAIALMVGVTVQLAQRALVDPLTWLLALASLLILLRFQLNSAWLILGGAALGFLTRLVVGA